MNDNNSSNASTGQSLVTRVLARKSELEALLASTPGQTSRTQNDISTALNTLNALLSGDLLNVPPVVLADMNRWLERNKHLAESETPALSEAPAPAGSGESSIATGLPMAEAVAEAWHPNS